MRQIIDIFYEILGCGDNYVKVMTNQIPPLNTQTYVSCRFKENSWFFVSILFLLHFSESHVVKLPDGKFRRTYLVETLDVCWQFYRI